MIWRKWKGERKGSQVWGILIVWKKMAGLWSSSKVQDAEETDDGPKCRWQNRNCMINEIVFACFCSCSNMYRCHMCEIYPNQRILWWLSYSRWNTNKAEIYLMKQITLEMLCNGDRFSCRMCLIYCFALSPSTVFWARYIFLPTGFMVWLHKEKLCSFFYQPNLNHITRKSVCDNQWFSHG